MEPKHDIDARTWTGVLTHGQSSLLSLVDARASKPFSFPFRSAMTSLLLTKCVSAAINEWHSNLRSKSNLMWWHRIAVYILSHIPPPLAHSKRTIYDVVAFVLFTIVSRQFSYYVCYYYCRVFGCPFYAFIVFPFCARFVHAEHTHARTLLLHVRHAGHYQAASVITCFMQPNETINWTFCNKDESAYSNSERVSFKTLIPLPTILSMFVNWQSTNWLMRCVSRSPAKQPNSLADAQTCLRNVVATSNRFPFHSACKRIAGVDGGPNTQTLTSRHPTI